MVRAIPNAYGPTRGAAALALHREGRDLKQIAALLGLRDAAAARKALWNGVRAERSNSGGLLWRPDLPRARRDALERHAAARGLTVEALADRLLAVLAEEPVLLGNLIDDAHDARPEPETRP